jgi:hypothetical protein
MREYLQVLGLPRQL